MARVTGPLGSLTAAGQFGHTLIFQGGQQGTQVKKFATPKNPRTDAQKQTRRYTGPITRAWKSLMQVSRDSWSMGEDSKTNNGYHAYMSNALRRFMRDDKPTAYRGYVNEGNVPGWSISNWRFEGTSLCGTITVEDVNNFWMLGILQTEAFDERPRLSDLIYLKEIGGRESWDFRIALRTAASICLMSWAIAETGFAEYFLFGAQIYELTTEGIQPLQGETRPWWP